jgi:hypothetical protein
VEFANAVAAWHRDFTRNRVTLRTWELAEKMWAAEAEEKLLALFTGGVKGDRKLNAMYNEYRQFLLHHHDPVA